jgi:hypothetical protein
MSTGETDFKGANMKIGKIGIVSLFVLITLFSKSFAMLNFENDEDYIKAFTTTDLNTRIVALENLNSLLQSGQKISDKLRDVCHLVIEQEMTGKSKVDTSHDEENQYNNGIFTLIINLNDDKTFPYLFNGIFGARSINAILSHGDAGLDEVLKHFSEYDAFDLEKKRGFINLLTAFIKPKNQGFIAKGPTRDEIKKFILTKLKNTAYPPRPPESDAHYLKEMKNIDEYIKEPILDFILNLGDADTLPLVEDLAKNDQGYEEVTTDYLPYRKMDDEERYKHIDEIKRIRKRESEVNAASGKESPVKYYPVREKAQKVLEELKKKNGIK